MTTPWHEDDEFWDDLAPVMFPARSWERARQDVQFIFEQLSDIGVRPEGEAWRLLDMPCGPGRHLVAAAESGAHIVGVDRTASYLERARERVGSSTVELMCGDMRTVELPNSTFDVGWNLFSSLGYFDTTDEDVGVLRRFHAALRPGGVLVLEALAKETLARIYEPMRYVEEGGWVIQMRSSLSDDWSRIHQDWQMHRNGQVRAHQFSHFVYAASEYKSMVRAAGFTGQIRCFGGSDAQPFDHRSNRFWLFAVK